MKNSVKVWGIIFAIALVIIGIIIPIPEKKISMWSFEKGEGYEEYVGGDAYNIQIEASLRGGIIAGRTIAKAVLISSGVILFFLIMVGDQIICCLAYNVQKNFPVEEAKYVERQDSSGSETKHIKPSNNSHTSDISIVDIEHNLYNALIDFCPELGNTQVLNCQYRVPDNSGMKPLSIERNGDGVLVAYTYMDNGKLMYEPTITFRFNTDTKTASIETYEMSSKKIRRNFINDENSASKIETEKMVLDTFFYEAIINGYKLVSKGTG